MWKSKSEIDNPPQTCLGSLKEKKKKSSRFIKVKAKGAPGSVFFPFSFFFKFQVANWDARSQCEEMRCCNGALMWSSVICRYISSFAKVSSPPHSFYKKTPHFTPLIIWLLFSPSQQLGLWGKTGWSNSEKKRTISSSNLETLEDLITPWWRSRDLTEERWIK